MGRKFLKMCRGVILATIGVSTGQLVASRIKTKPEIWTMFFASCANWGFNFSQMFITHGFVDGRSNMPTNVWHDLTIFSGSNFTLKGVSWLCNPCKRSSTYMLSFSDVNWITQLKSPWPKDKYVQLVQHNNSPLNCPVLAVLTYLYSTALLT